LIAVRTAKKYDDNSASLAEFGVDNSRSLKRMTNPALGHFDQSQRFKKPDDLDDARYDSREIQRSGGAMGNAQNLCTWT